ncbi:MAG: hypothetical protein FWG68_06585, partial [Defluviitaleaceae bacterium]|nr:hypothetical protein [Defluviitaleaceae bacterium]
MGKRATMANRATRANGRHRNGQTGDIGTGKRATSEWANGRHRNGQTGDIGTGKRATSERANG